jgi:hypothetical protein
LDIPQNHTSTQLTAQPPVIPAPPTPPPTQPHTTAALGPVVLLQIQHAPIQPLLAAPIQPLLAAPILSEHGSQGSQRQPLGQPIGPNWLERKSVADDDRANMEAVKMCWLQMDEISKRTVGLGHRGIVVKHTAAVSFWVAVHCPKG